MAEAKRKKEKPGDLLGSVDKDVSGASVFISYSRKGVWCLSKTRQQAAESALHCELCRQGVREDDVRLLGDGRQEHLGRLGGYSAQQ